PCHQTYPQSQSLELCGQSASLYIENAHLTIDRYSLVPQDQNPATRPHDLHPPLAPPRYPNTSWCRHNGWPHCSCPSLSSEAYCHPGAHAACDPPERVHLEWSRQNWLYSEVQRSQRYSLFPPSWFYRDRSAPVSASCACQCTWSSQCWYHSRGHRRQPKPHHLLSALAVSAHSCRPHRILAYRPAPASRPSYPLR